MRGKQNRPGGKTSATGIAQPCCLRRAGAALFSLQLCLWLALPSAALSQEEQEGAAGLYKGWQVRERPAHRPAQGQSRRLTIVATSDLHGWIVRDTLHPRKRAGGLAHLAPLIATLRREDSELILLDGGDTLKGAPNLDYLAQYDPLRIPPVLQAMNRLGYEAMTVGNHDLERGPRAVRRWVAQSRFVWLAANMLSRGDAPPHSRGWSGKAGEPLLPPYHIIERGGLRVGVLGMTSPGAPIWVDAAYLRKVRFASLQAAAERWLPLLRRVERADVVIGLLHSGLQGGYDRSTALRHGLPLPNGAGYLADRETPPGEGFDLIISGHAHRLAPRKPSGADSPYAVPVVQPGAHGEALAVVRMTLHEERNRWRVRTLRRETRRAAHKPDAELLRMLKPPLEATRAWLAQPTQIVQHAPARREAFYRCAGRISHDAMLYHQERAGASRSEKAEQKKREQKSDTETRMKGERPGIFSLLPLFWRRDTSRQPKGIIPLSRAVLYRWMPYANTLVQARLHTRQLALLLRPYARWKQKLRVRSTTVLHPGGLQVEIAPGGTEVLALYPEGGGPPIHAPQRVWLTNYHWNGGGGLARRALLHPSQREGALSVTLRELVFALLRRPGYALPTPCRSFLKTTPPALQSTRR